MTHGDLRQRAGRTSRRLRLGLVGAGDVAHRDYLPEMHRLGNRVDLVAVCTRSRERAESTARRYRIPRWFTDHRAVLELEDVDAILNLTPIPTHYQVTLDSLRAGKHVYSEKPLALTSAQARDLVQEARRRSLVLVAAPAITLFPQVQWAAQVLAAGGVGTVHSVYARAFGGVPPWPGYTSDPSPYFDADVGPLVDMAVYPLHVIMSLIGPVSHVMALSARTRDHFHVTGGPADRTTVRVQCDDNWLLLLRCAGGILACIEANYSAHASGGPDFELRGERGTLGIDLLNVARPGFLFSVEKGEWIERPIPHERTAGPDHILGVRELVECIEEGRPPALDPMEAVAVLEIIEAAKRSALEGRAIEVPRPRRDAPSEANGER